MINTVDTPILIYEPVLIEIIPELPKIDGIDMILSETGEKYQCQS